MSAILTRATMDDKDLIDPETIFGVSAEYWEKLEEGRVLQSRGLDNYIRTLNVRKMLELVKIRKEMLDKS